jgi:hypothetical protein
MLHIVASTSQILACSVNADRRNLKIYKFEVTSNKYSYKFITAADSSVPVVLVLVRVGIAQSV